MRFSGFLLLILAVMLSTCTQKQNGKKETTDLTHKIEISDAWIRPGNAGNTSSGYLTIYNGSAMTDTLIGVYTPAAGLAEIHESYKQEGGLVGMRPAGKQTIAPGDTMKLKPGGYHIMLMQLNQDLAPRDTIKLNLEFSVQGVISTDAEVRQPGN